MRATATRTIEHLDFTHEEPCETTRNQNRCERAADYAITTQCPECDQTFLPAFICAPCYRYGMARTGPAITCLVCGHRPRLVDCLIERRSIR